MAVPPDEASATTTTAMNQSVTLDETAAELTSDKTTEKIENKNVEQEAKQEAKQEAQQEDYQPSTASLILPARGEISRSAPSSSRQFHTSEIAAVPWYRSGVGALMIVLAVIGGGYLAVRKWVPTMRPPDGNIIKVLSRTSLSPKHQAALIKVGKRMLLVGMTAESMTTLTELTDDDELGDVMVSPGDAKREHRAQFEAMLGQEQDRFTDEDESDVETTQSLQGLCREPLSKLLHRLRQLQSSP